MKTLRAAPTLVCMDCSNVKNVNRMDANEWIATNGNSIIDKSKILEKRSLSVKKNSQFRLSKRVNAKMEHYYRITTPHVRSCIIFMM